MDQAKRVEILDTTLRDGSYVIDFQFTADDTALIASALEFAGVGLIEVGHGLGLGAARAGKGDQASSDEEYLQAARGVLKRARFGAFFIPGIGRDDDLRMAAACGMNFLRVGVNITEVSEARPYIRLAKDLGMTVSANLMKSYAVNPETFAQCAARAADWGADVACLVDSAGGMLPEEVRRYTEAGLAACEARMGFHGHDNLSLAMANTLEALDAGASVVDSSLQGLGRSEGNAVTEVLVAILHKRDLCTDVNVDALLDVGEAFIRPLLHGPSRTALGITTGRARFHSSFLGRVMQVATAYGVDPHDLILRLGERNQVDAPLELIEELANDLVNRGPRAAVRVDMAATRAEAPADFHGQVRTRVRELRERSRKTGLDSVLNVVVTPHEMTRVSPFVETRFGCSISSIMLADASLLRSVLAAADGLVDYVLLDPCGQPAPDVLQQSVLLLYSDHEMWARATTSHLTMLFDSDIAGKTFAVCGVSSLAARVAAALHEQGVRVVLDLSDGGSTGGLDGVTLAPLGSALQEADAVVSLSPRRPLVGPDEVAAMRADALLYDGGIGSLEREAVPAAEARGIRVVRVDLRPSISATALQLIQTRRIVHEFMGREEWEGVSVVSGGLIGRQGEIIVDSISRPTRIIGIGDGKGGILQASSDDPTVCTVRRVIAEKLLRRQPDGNGKQ